MKAHSDTADDLLLRHAAGRLDAGFSLLMDTHLALSAEARTLYAQYEALGGVILDEITPADVDPAALNRALSAIESLKTNKSNNLVHAPRLPAMPECFTQPPPLRMTQIDSWRWIAPGVHSARIALPKGAKSRAFLLEIAPEVTVPRHGHEGDEATCVLTGGFQDRGAHYGPGDIARADERIEHDIVIDPGEPCLCLIAMEGRTRPNSWFGRLYQNFRDI
jgi:putative transcriptional regulator